MGPLELLYSWQAVLCAIACSGVTQLVKTVMDLTMGAKKRDGSRVLSKLVLPLMPIVVGGAYAAFVPLRPEVLIEHVTTHVGGAWQLVAYAAWGGACGQFADYLFSRAKKTLASTSERPLGSGE